MSVRDSLRQDLKQALKERDKTTAATIRSALAAIENAEAVAVPQDSNAALGTVGLSRDVPRRTLTADDVTAILRDEMWELQQALDGYVARGQHTAAADARTGLEILGHYVDLET